MVGLFSLTIVEYRSFNGYSVAVKRLVVLIIILVVCSAGCRKQNSVTSRPATLSVQQLVREPARYSHQLITIDGCYIRSFERSTLQPCEAAKHEQMVWVDSAETEFTMRNIRGNLPRQYVPKALESQSTSPDDFVFRYNEAQSRAAWAKLSAAGAAGMHVIVRGQFETISPAKANITPYKSGAGFGHLAQYEHQLILVDVLEPK